MRTRNGRGQSRLRRTGGDNHGGALCAVQISAPGSAPELVEVPLREPGPGTVRIAVEACGVCHSDLLIAGGFLPGTTFPVTPGHEIAGRIDALGEGVEGQQVGDRVAVGWYGGSCGRCDACREGDAIHCPQLAIPGVAYSGGYADSVIVPAGALAVVPQELTAAEAAPLACAGVTVFNALRRSAARPGDTVAVLGLGGLGHLGVQFAHAMGFRTVAIAPWSGEGAAGVPARRRPLRPLLRRRRRHPGHSALRGPDRRAGLDRGGAPSKTPPPPSTR